MSFVGIPPNPVLVDNQHVSTPTSLYKSTVADVEPVRLGIPEERRSIVVDGKTYALDVGPKPTRDATFDIYERIEAQNAVWI